MRIKILGSIAMLSLLLSCGQKSSDDKNSDSSATGLNDVSKVSDLGLDSALALNLPDIVSGSGSASLVGKKSFEACMLKNTLNEGVQGVKEIGNMFCHFGVEPEIVANKKINITFTSADAFGKESFQLFIDKSDPSKIRVSFCEDRKLTTYLEITGVRSGKAKGTAIYRGSEEGNNWASSISFDAGYTTEGVKTFLTKDSYTADGGEQFKRFLGLVLKSEGVNKVLAAEAGTWQGEDFNRNMAALFNNDQGGALIKESYSYNGESFNGSYRSFFEKSGLSLSPDSSDDFKAPDGSLYVKPSLVPKNLPEDFAVDSFPAEAWDCQNEDTTIALDPNSAEHQACDAESDRYTSVNCHGSDDYETGEAEDIDESQLLESDEIHELDAE